MNSKQLKAHRRRARQALKKKGQSEKGQSEEGQSEEGSQTHDTQITHSILNRVVSFDHFTLDSTGFALKPVRGLIIKSAHINNEEVLTIKIIDQDPFSSGRTNKRIESLMMSQDTITASVGSLLNFKLN